MLGNLWSNWTIWGKPATMRKHAPNKRRAAMCVELLEDRCVPTVAIAEFPVLTAGSAPSGITTGPDGNVWFTENAANQIGMINPTTHAISEYPVLTAGSGPLGITAGPNGTVWFTENVADKIGEINTATDVVTEFPIPTANSGPSGITVGPDGNIWFTEATASKIGEINPATDVVSEFPTTTAGSSPTDIIAGPDGNVWFTEASGNQIGTINPTFHNIVEYPIPVGTSTPDAILIGPNGNLWFTENTANQIGEITPASHTFAVFKLPKGSTNPTGITVGADGNLWFTESSSDQIGTFNLPGNTITENAVPTLNSSPTQITAGPGGTLWFTEAAGNQIGEIVEAPAITTIPENQTVTQGQTATFTSAAVGFPTPTVQWQVSTNLGATFTPLANNGVFNGVNTGTLTILGTTPAMNGYQFEAVYTNGVSPAPVVTTAPVVLFVKPALSIVPALPQGTVGNSYDHVLSVVGSTSAFSVFLVNSFLPGTTGLTFGDITTNPLNGTITISGTPTAAGAATFTVVVADVAGNTLTQNMTLTIRPPLSIGTPALPGGTVASNYNQVITIVGGALPYLTFSVTNFSAGGTGLTLSEIKTNAAAGTVTVNGMPITAGTASFTVNVTDSEGTTVTNAYTIAVNPPLVITPSLPAGTAGTLYNKTLTVTGGGVPYTTFTVSNFSAGATGLTSANLAIDPVADAITLDGTPTAAGTITFTVNVVDAIGAVLNKTYTITIHHGLAITPTLPQGTAGLKYLHTIAITGGTAPYEPVTVTGFSDSGTGLTASMITVNPAAGTIAINGTPSAAGTATFTVNVSDSAGSSLTQVYTITINAVPTLGSLSATQWTLGIGGFNGASAISGGTAPFTIFSSTGVPTGFMPVVTGSKLGFTGTPIAAGGFVTVITLHDAAGASFAKSFGITINAAPTLGSLTATKWTIGSAGFNGVLVATEGTGSFTINGSSGLPAGLKLALTGKTISFTGTPTVAGTFAGSVTVRDAVGSAVTKTFSITIDATPTLGSLTTTQWTVGKSAFSGSLAITGGTGPFTIASASGLPTGLTAIVSGNSIRFTGAPTSVQTFAAGSVTIHDASGVSATRTFSITINPPVEMLTTSLPSTKMGLLYNSSVQAKGGTGVLAYAVSAGGMPPGIQVSKTGVIRGVARGFGTFTFTITATDAAGATASEKYTLTLAL